MLCIQVFKKIVHIKVGRSKSRDWLLQNWLNAWSQNCDLFSRPKKIYSINFE